MPGPEDYDIECQLSGGQARKLLSLCRKVGSVRITRHALEKADLTGHARIDIDNVLRSGACTEAGEWHEGHGQWRYRFHTPRFAVVVAFEKISSYVVVTFWEKKGGLK